MSTIALVPARGGSVRIPRKNLKMVGGLSLLARAILCARQVNRVHAVFVSTDDDEIEMEARKHKALLIRRPPEISQAETSMEAVVDHFIQSEDVSDPSIIVLLEPSSPFRTDQDIVECLAYLDSRPDAMGVRTVSRVEDPNYFLHLIGSGGFLNPLTPMAYELREHPPIFRDNGLVNAFRVGLYREHRKLLSSAILAVETSAGRGIDVDLPADLELARSYADEWES